MISGAAPDVMKSGKSSPKKRRVAYDAKAWLGLSIIQMTFDIVELLSLS